MLKSSRRWILSPKLFVSLVSEALRGPTAAFPDERAVFKKKRKKRGSHFSLSIRAVSYYGRTSQKNLFGTLMTESDTLIC